MFTKREVHLLINSFGQVMWSYFGAPAPKSLGRKEGWPSDVIVKEGVCFIASGSVPISANPPISHNDQAE